MNKIGVRGHDFGKMSIADLPIYIKEKGFDALQLAPTKAIEGINIFEDITEKILNEARESFFKNDVEISVYGCYVEVGLLDKEKRLKEVEKFKRGITHSKILGAKVIGTETTAFPLHGEREDAYQGLKDSVCRMVEEAERVGVDIALEPVVTNVLNTPELTKRLLDEVKSDRLKIILDVVNLFTVENIINQREIINSAFNLLGDKIKVLHLKDVSLIGKRSIEELNITNGIFCTEFIGNGVVDYKNILSFVKGKEIPLLREGATLESYKVDIANVKNMLYS
ncbi:MAG: sugar phosphate isomerase/epimerase family protein [Lachnospirales bacterium]